MNITVYDDGSIYEGRIVSYSFTWEGRQIDLAKVREFDTDVGRTRGFVKFTDGTRLALNKKRGFFSKRHKLLLEGHVVVHVDSLNADIRFDTKQVERIVFDRKHGRNDDPRESESPDHARSQNGSANGSAVEPDASSPRHATTAMPSR